MYTPPKPPNPMAKHTDAHNPRILVVASRIHEIQLRETIIDARQGAILNESNRLDDELADLNDERNMLAREMDKLTT